MPVLENHSMNLFSVLNLTLNIIIYHLIEIYYSKNQNYKFKIFKLFKTNIASYVLEKFKF